MRIRALPRRGRNMVFALMALLVATVANLQALPAHAAQINAIDPDSITLSSLTRPDQMIRVHDDVQINATWAMPVNGKSGDTFSLGLPPVLRGQGGSFDLKGTGAQKDLVFGSCQVEATEVTCTLSDEVTGKTNVGGELWVRARASQKHAGATLTFTVNGTAKKEVPLPKGANEIDYDQWRPSEYRKFGYFNEDVLVWRVVLPGSQIAGQDSLTISDPYAVEGTDFTVQYASFYKIPNTAECWNNNESPECRTNLWNTSGVRTDGVNFTVDNDKDSISGTVQGPFDANTIYTLHLNLTTDSQILPGSEFPNTATINGKAVSQTATREATGGGTGAGDTVGHIELVKKVEGGAVPDDTVFPVKYSYSMGGKDYSGTLELKADGTPTVLRNVLGGTKVTLTEELPKVANADFGDPVFSGDGVADGGADSKSAVVTVVGGKRTTMTLTNPIREVPKVVPVSPAIQAGVCQPGSTTPTDPTVTKPVTEGITYSDPVLTPQAGSNVVKVTMTATAENGKQIDAGNLPAGWTMNQDGTATFNGEVTQPECEPTVVVPVSPVITLGVCEPGSTEPTEPKVEFPATEGITYSEETQKVENGKLTVTRKATANPGYKFGDLPEGWTANADGSASFEAVKDQPKCDTPVVPVAPMVDPGVCKPGSVTPSDPTVTLPSAEGVKYGSPEITSEGSKATVKVVATAEDGFVFKRDGLPEGWTLSDDAKTATFVKVVDQPKCDTPVVPVAPMVDPGVCKPGSTTPTEPKVNVPTTANVVYEGLNVKVENATVKVTLTAKAAAGYVFDTASLPEGWTSADGFTATYSGEVKQPACEEPVVVPVAPMVDPGVCKPGSTTPTEPKVSVPTTAGVSYGKPQVKVDSGVVKVTVTATPAKGKKFDKSSLPSGWTLNSDGTATYSGDVKQPSCQAPVTPVNPGIVPGVCRPGSESPTPPTVTTPKVPGLVYGKPKIIEGDGKVSITVTVTPEPGRTITGLKDGWTLNADGTATYTYVGKTPACVKPGLPKTGD